MADGLESHRDQLETNFSSPQERYWMSELSYDEEKPDLRVIAEVASTWFGGWLKIIQ